MRPLRIRGGEPPGYLPASDGRSRHVEITSDLGAVRDAEVVYTDVWTSMGQEAENAQRQADFAGFQVSPEMMELAGPQSVFMHCLPAHRGEEVAAEVIDGPQSVVFDEAENRLHAQKGVLAWALGAVR